jgi:D-xylulose kinase
VVRKGLEARVSLLHGGDQVYLLGLDVGTTSVKGALFDLQGNMIAVASQEYDLLNPYPDFVELETEAYWIACKEVIREVLGRSKVCADDVSATAVVSQAETVIVLDKENKPLRNAIVWIDNRSKEEAEYLAGRIPRQEFYKTTGLPHLIATWPVAKILWIKRNQPHIYLAAAKFVLVQDYMNFKLSGHLATDYSISSCTGFLDIRKREWWRGMLDEIDIAEDRLSDLHTSGTSLGNITRTAAAETGLSEKTIVSTGAIDQAAAAIGAGNISPGNVTESTGSCCTIVATVDRPIYDAKYRLPCQCHAVKGLYFLTPYIQTAGMLLRWFRDKFSFEETQIEALTGIDAYELMSMESSRIPPGSDNLVILPHLTGTGSPEYDTDARGVVFGLTLRHTKPHLVKAIMESIAYSLRRNIELLEEMGISCSEVRSIGGGARSMEWMRIKSDILQRRMLTLKTEETAALGAAILAGAASKILPSVQVASETMVSTKSIVEPLSSNKATYDRLYHTYVELYDTVKPLFRFIGG